MPSARDLRQRIRVERRSQTATARGGLGDWETLITSRRAKLTPRPVTGNPETVLAARSQGTAIFDCWLRNDSETSTIRPDDRLVDARDGRIFNVRFAQDMDGRGNWLLLQCDLGVADG